MCLIRKQEATEGHTYQGRAEVGKLKGEGEHEAVKRCTRLVQDIDVAKSAKGCGMVGSPGAEGPVPGGLSKQYEDYQMDTSFSKITRVLHPRGW